MKILLRLCYSYTGFLAVLTFFMPEATGLNASSGLFARLILASVFIVISAALFSLSKQEEFSSLIRSSLPFGIGIFVFLIVLGVIGLFVHDYTNALKFLLMDIVFLCIHTFFMTMFVLNLKRRQSLRS